MTNRKKRLKKGIESMQEQIEDHEEKKRQAKLSNGTYKEIIDPIENVSTSRLIDKIVTQNV